MTFTNPFMQLKNKLVSPQCALDKGGFHIRIAAFRFIGTYSWFFDILLIMKLYEKQVSISEIVQKGALKKAANGIIALRL